MQKGVLYGGHSCTEDYEAYAKIEFDSMFEHMCCLGWDATVGMLLRTYVKVRILGPMLQAEANKWLLG